MTVDMYPSEVLICHHVHSAILTLVQVAGVRHDLLTIVYSGFSHFCFWQCSESILTGSLPVHEAPPITSFTLGFFGSSEVAAGAFFEASADFSAAALACFVPGLGPPRESGFFFGPIAVGCRGIIAHARGESNRAWEVALFDAKPPLQ